MDYFEYLNLMTPTLVILLLIAVGPLFYKNWRRDKERQTIMENERIRIGKRREDREENLERERLRIQQKQIRIQQEQAHGNQQQNEDLLEKMKENFAQQNVGVNSGGYIILDLPENQQGLFHDLLKGFEDYAKLKGYSISFSIDNSVVNRIAFKFTINEGGISVGTATVRQDIREYIDKIKNDDDLSDMPKILTPIEHELVLTTLKNRISFLKQNYELERNAKELCKFFIGHLNSSNLGINSQPSVFVQTGGTVQPHNYLANNSPNAIQGHNNIQDVDNSIHIADSFNERKNQIDNLSKLIELIQSQENKEDSSEEIVKNLEKVKEELEDEKKPDKSRIKKWLEKANVCLNLDVAKFSKEVIEFGRKVFESFGLIS